MGLALKVVFLDAAGTLFDTRQPVGRTYAEIARRHGLEAGERAVAAGFRRAFGRPPGLAFGRGHAAATLREMERRWWYERVGETFRGLGEFRDFDAYFAELFAYFAEPANWQLFPETAEVLSDLKARGLKLGVISNFDFRVHRILKELGIARYLDSVTISSEAGWAKPDRRIFELALTSHSVKAAEALHVGDSPALDFSGARAAGISAILIDREQKPNSDSPISQGRLSSLLPLLDLVGRGKFS